MTRLIIRCLALLLLLGVPVLAEDTIQAGVDLWSTSSTGRTHTSFANDPIPADFFCPGSKPFAGRIAFRGVPLAAEPAKSLGQTDTIVRRLDQAAFDGKGEATTRIQLMALSLKGEKPIDVGCGVFDVTASLDGNEQPTTTMRIVKTGPNGGSYIAPLALNVKLTFTPLAGTKGTPRTLIRQVTLGPSTNAMWSYTTTAAYGGQVRVDTDGDGKPDTALPQPSNFVAGIQPAATTSPGSVVISPCRLYPDATGCPPGYCLWEACHCTADPDDWDPFDKGEGCRYLHCLWVCLASPGSPGGPTPCPVIVNTPETL